VVCSSDYLVDIPLPGRGLADSGGTVIKVIARVSPRLPVCVFYDLCSNFMPQSGFEIPAPGQSREILCPQLAGSAWLTDAGQALLCHFE